MAIREVKSTIFGVIGAGYTAPNSVSRAGKITRVCGEVSNLAADNAGSTYLLCEVPSNWIMLPESLVLVDGWGFAQCVLGVKQDTDILLDILESAANANGDAIITRFGSNWNKPFWEQCGLSADPLAPLQLQLIGEADAAGAGTAKFDLHFASHI